jgi:hypothetical protein
MTTSRECTKCGETKDFSCFNKDKTAKFGIKPRCIECTNQQKAEYRKNNREKIIASSRKYSQRPETKERKKQYREDNKEKIKETNAKYIEANKDKIKEQQKLYAQNNRDKINERRKQYLASNPNARLAHNLRARFHDALKRSSFGKTSTTIHFLGAEIETIKQHLQTLFLQGMSWDNYGEWEIDHIIPIASFDLSSEEEQLRCFHYTNLQPLWSSENRSKGKKILK